MFQKSDGSARSVCYCFGYSVKAVREDAESERIVAEHPKGRWAAGAAVVAAIASSACCWLPLGLITLGVSAGGVGAFFEAYRSWFLGATSGLLGLGFYYVYWRKAPCAPGDACAMPNPRLTRLNKILLWGATGFVIAFASFPNYVAYLVGEGTTPAAQVATTPPAPHPAVSTAVTRTYLIDGMSCEGCTVHIRDEVAKVAGVTSVEVVYDDELVRVTFASAAAANDVSIIAAIDEAGFEGRRASQRE